MTADIDPAILWELAKSRHREDLRVVEADRTVRQAHLREPDLRYRMIVALANQLIALGLRLKQRYEPQPASGHLYRSSSP